MLHDLYFTKNFLEVVNIELSFVDDLDRHLATEQYNTTSHQLLRMFSSDFLTLVVFLYFRIFLNFQFYSRGN